jgi:hypothetical protein
LVRTAWRSLALLSWSRIAGFDDRAERFFQKVSPLGVSGIPYGCKACGHGKKKMRNYFHLFEEKLWTNPARLIGCSCRQQTRRRKLKTKMKMKITISHDQESIDPSATYPEDQFAEVRNALEADYEKAILAVYPESEIDFSGTDATYAIVVTETGMDDPSEIEKNVQNICESVFETGNFWI